MKNDGRGQGLNGCGHGDEEENSDGGDAWISSPEGISMFILRKRDFCSSLPPDGISACFPS